MRNEQDCIACLSPDVLEFFMEDQSCLLIERREWFIHQQYFRVHDKRPCDGHTLLHSAGKFMRIGICEIYKVYHSKAVHRLFFNFCFGQLFKVQAVGNILLYGHPWKQSAFLEYDDAVGAGFVHCFAVDQDFSGGGCFESCDQFQYCRLSAAGRSEKSNERAFFNIKVDIIQYLQFSFVIFSKFLMYVFQLYFQVRSPPKIKSYQTNRNNNRKNRVSQYRLTKLTKYILYI